MQEYIDNLTKDIKELELLIESDSQVFKDIEVRINGYKQNLRRLVRAREALTGEAGTEIPAVDAGEADTRDPSSSPVRVRKKELPPHLICSCGGEMYETYKQAPSGKHIPVILCNDCSNERYIG